MYDYLRKAVQQFPEKIAIKYKDVELSYSELDDVIKKIADECLDSKYIKLEYRRLRKTAIDMDFLNEFTSELIKDDIDITNKIKEKIGERIC